MSSNKLPGEIIDEHDGDDGSDHIKTCEDGRFIVKALTSLEDFNAYFSAQLKPRRCGYCGWFGDACFWVFAKAGKASLSVVFIHGVACGSQAFAFTTGSAIRFDSSLVFCLAAQQLNPHVLA